jgi:hypothetical protein
LNPPRLFAIVEDLRRREAESNWFEFKGNNTNPEMIAKTFAGFANGAA